MSGQLAHTPADIIRRVLIELGIGADPPAVPWPVYSPTLPSTPDNCMATKNTTPVDGGRDMVTSDRQEAHGVQLTVRATTEAVGYAKAQAAGLAMDKQMNGYAITIDAATYHVFTVEKAGGVLPLGKEQNSSRFLYTVNCLVYVRQIT